MKYSIFLNPPVDFQPTLEVASCYCEWQDKILFLKRHPQKSQGNTWGVPAGKLEKNENPMMAVIRETKEEIGVHLDECCLEIIGRMYSRLPHMDYVYHMFRKRFDTLPVIDLALDEHLEANWVTIDEALKLPLIAGGIEALQYYQQVSRV